MDTHIKIELKQSMSLTDKQVHINFTSFMDIIKYWWEKEAFYLEDISSRENDPLWKTSEK